MRKSSKLTARLNPSMPRNEFFLLKRTVRRKISKSAAKPKSKSMARTPTLIQSKSARVMLVSYHDDLEVVVSIEVSSKVSAAPKDAVQHDGHAYKFFPEVLTWHRAKKCCEEMGGHLASIGSSNENEVVFNLAKKSM